MDGILLNIWAGLSIFGALGKLKLGGPLKQPCNAFISSYSDCMGTRLFIHVKSYSYITVVCKCLEVLTMAVQKEV